MKSQTILDGLSVVTASLILLVGVSLLAGWIPAEFRYTLGGMMTAYALYRLGMAIARLRRAGESGGPESDDNDIDEPHETAR